MNYREKTYLNRPLGKVEKVIDIYASVGKAPDGREFTSENLIQTMDETGIDHALISSISAGLGVQQQANIEAANARDQHPGRLHCLAWANPRQGKLALEDVARSLRVNKFVGVKFHPFLNRFYINDPMVGPFMRLAQQLKVPVLIHSAHDEFSLPARVFDLARRFPEVPIIMGHSGLAEGPYRGSLNLQAMILASLAPNIYLDTSWIDEWALKQGLGFLPHERILFGSDAPLGGAEYYKKLLSILDRQELSDKSLKLIMHSTAAKLFKLKF